MRGDGYAVNRNPYQPGAWAIAAPALDSDGKPLATLPSGARYDPERLRELGRLVAESSVEASALRLDA